jgi:hypothetical protein
MKERLNIAGTLQARRGVRVTWLARVSMLACISSCLIASARQASAAAGQWQIGGRLGVASLRGAGVGASGEAFLQRGISDSIDLDLQALTSVHPFQPGSKSAMAVNDAAWAFALAPGVLYRWDVLRTIPYAGLGVGVYNWSGVEAELKGIRFGGSGRLGLEYLLTRDVFLSVQTSAHFVLTDSGIRLPLFQLGVGAGHAWGW